MICLNQNQKAILSFPSYMDTDSLVFFVAGNTLDEVIREDMRVLWELYMKKTIMECEASEFVQEGKLKIEGVYVSGLFRSMKSYFLQETEDPKDKLVRAKGMPNVVQKVMTDEDFRMTEEIDNRHFNFFKLRPTQGMSITLGQYTRVNSTCINPKRNLKRVSLISNRSLVCNLCFGHLFSEPDAHLASGLDRTVGPA